MTDKPDPAESIGAMCVTLATEIEFAPPQALFEATRALEVMADDPGIKPKHQNLFRALAAAIEAKSQVLTVVTVEGARAFPIDMLRYDGLHPRTEVDANNIARSIAREAEGLPGEMQRVELSRMAEEGWQPKRERWESKFRWRVINVEVFP